MKTEKPDLKTIESVCSGCGICHALYGFQLKQDRKGFPTIVTDSVDDCIKLQALCPAFYYGQEAKHDVWGKIQLALVGYSSNPEIRHQASSGGALTELCIYMLETGLVNGIIHTAFDPEDQTKNIACVSYTVDEVRSRCGSRYSISFTLYEINNLMKPEERYAFVGKPCDVMALRNAAALYPELGEKIPYLLSFFCAGMPSVDAQRELLTAMGTEKDQLSSITYRGNGWPGFTTAVEKDGTVLKMEYKNAWGKYLGRDIRNICRFCMDGTGDAADIVCADFWYLGQDGSPDFSEHEGRNIIISRTDKGAQLLRGAVVASRLTIEEDFTGKIETDFHRYQPAQYKRKGTMGSMISAMKLSGKQTPQYSKSYLKKYGSHMAPDVKLNFFWGTLKRIIKGKI